MTNNGRDGLVAIGGPITGNTASNNGDRGIAGVNATVVNNTANENGAAGILAQSSTVLENTAIGNGGVGLDLDGFSGYASNVLNENNGGNANPPVEGGIEIGTNVCGGDTICP